MNDIDNLTREIQLERLLNSISSIPTNYFLHYGKNASFFFSLDIIIYFYLFRLFFLIKNHVKTNIKTYIKGAAHCPF